MAFSRFSTVRPCERRNGRPRSKRPFRRRNRRERRRVDPRIRLSIVAIRSVRDNECCASNADNPRRVVRDTPGPRRELESGPRAPRPAPGPHRFAARGRQGDATGLPSPLPPTPLFSILRSPLSSPHTTKASHSRLKPRGPLGATTHLPAARATPHLPRSLTEKHRGPGCRWSCMPWAPSLPFHPGLRIIVVQPAVTPTIFLIHLETDLGSAKRPRSTCCHSYHTYLRCM